jgi:SAM-dependent methyltransferase
MMWFDRKDARCLFIDKRQETHPIDIGTPGTIGRAPIVVAPDVVADFTKMPFADESFSLVVFDPPHIKNGNVKGIFPRKYGRLPNDWRGMLTAGFRECFRVLKPRGTLIFKWADSCFPASEVVACTEESPLFGHRAGIHTHWYVFMKGFSSAKPE